jgi:hypothetical protein
MGFEYSTVIGGSGDDVRSIVSGLAADEALEVLGPTDGAVIALRFRANPPRAHWPEDATITFEPGRVVLTVHAGTREQRAHLVDAIDTLIAQTGCTGRLIED